MKGYKIVVYKMDGDYLSEGIMTFIDDKNYQESSAEKLVEVAIKRAVDILEERLAILNIETNGAGDVWSGIPTRTWKDNIETQTKRKMFTLHELR